MKLKQQEIELRVGDSLRVGDYRVTVVEIDGEEVIVRVDDSAVPEPMDVAIRPR